MRIDSTAWGSLVCLVGCRNDTTASSLAKKSVYPLARAMNFVPGPACPRLASKLTGTLATVGGVLFDVDGPASGGASA